MSRNLILAIIFTGSFLYSCGDNTEENPENGAPLTQTKPVKNIYGTWQLAHINSITVDIDNEADPLLAEAKQNDLVTEGLLYSFFKDNTCTIVRGNGTYITDTWRLTKQGKQIIMITQKDTLQLGYSFEDYQPSIILKNKKTGLELQFNKTADNMVKLAEDPFHPSNNEWRISPKKSESNEALHNRLGNYFRHLAYVLHTASERDKPSVNFAFSEGPVKIYNGGIGIKPDIPESWLNTYHSKQDAEIAYAMFQKYLSESHYSGAGTNNWYKDDYAILVSIYGDVKSGKFPKLKR